MTQQWVYDDTGLVEIYIGVGMYFDTEICLGVLSDKRRTNV